AGRTDLDLQAQAPVLDALWPGLPGGAHLHAVLQGSLAQQSLALEGGYTPEEVEADVLGRAPAQARLRLDGGWAQGRGWRGTLETLEAGHAGLSLRSETPVPLELDAPDWAWKVGAARIAVGLDGQALLRLDHVASSGAGGRWDTSGRVDPLVV